MQPVAGLHHRSSLAPPTAHERLTHSPPGTEALARTAASAVAALAAVEAALLRVPVPKGCYASSDPALCPRDDVAALVALGLTWPEERQRLRHALGKVVNVVEGDAGRHLQRLEGMVAALAGGEFVYSDNAAAAAVYDSLQVPSCTDSSSAWRRPIVRRARELQVQVRRLQAVQRAPVPEPPAGSRTFLADGRPPCAVAAGALAAGAFSGAVATFVDHGLGMILLACVVVVGGTVALAWMGMMIAAHLAASDRRVLESAVAALARSIDVLSAYSFDAADDETYGSGLGAELCMTDPVDVKARIEADVEALKLLVGSLTAANVNALPTDAA